jgi:hypothetical protein
VSLAFGFVGNGCKVQIGKPNDLKIIVRLHGVFSFGLNENSISTTQRQNCCFQGLDISNEDRKVRSFVPLRRTTIITEELSAKDIQQGIMLVRLLRVPGRALASIRSAGLKARNARKDMLDRLAGKLFPTLLPLIVMDSDTGTGNIDRHDGRHILGTKLVHSFASKLNQDTRQQHGLIVVGATCSNPQRRPLQRGGQVRRGVDDQQGKSTMRQHLSILKKGSSVSKGGQGNSNRQGSQSRKWGL